MTDNNLIYKIDYDEQLQLDGFYQVTHINYGKSPMFMDISAKEIAADSRKTSISNKLYIEDVIKSINDFHGTEIDLKNEDRADLWKWFWLEYVHSFFELTEVMSNSIVTAYIGRHAIEMGFKYILVKNNEEFPKTHSIGELSDLVASKCKENSEKWEQIAKACNLYDEMIEDCNPEYFRYPVYKKNAYFAGNSLDISWLLYNFSIILLNQIHYLGLDLMIDKMKKG